ncbi:MAG: NADPH-dependent ferric siderophore reductase [Gordonia sp.]|nr:NADPH-dependent ferric siderophore reductase [Gordonia sp. (in: high G+C Gram-positive bacteria)]
MSRGLQGLVLKALGADDYGLTVTGKQQVTDSYVRISFKAGGLLGHHDRHPTQWIRLWIPNGDKQQQRGYTLVDPDEAADTFDIEFALHDGPAANWAVTAEVGETIGATVMGSKFAIPDPAPSEYLIFGDPAAVPAINSLLDAIGDVPARVWLEWQHESDKNLPLKATPATTVEWVERGTKGQALRDTAARLSVTPDAFGWVACEFYTTRDITKSLKSKLPKTSVKSQAYWK